MSEMRLSDYKYITKNGRWLITSLVGKNGKYTYARVVDHPFASDAGYVLEHRVVMENYLGRFLNFDEIVKHVDGNTKNNKIENLIVLKWAEAARIFGEKTVYRMKCPTCQGTFDREGRIINRYVKTGQLSFCTRVCSSSYVKKSRRNDEIVESYILSRNKVPSLTLKDAKSVIYGSELKKNTRIKQDSFYEIIEPRSALTERGCPFCEEKYKPQSSKQRYCSETCAKYGTRKFHVTDQELFKLAKRHSFLFLGKKFGVSDNAVRKRCKKLGFLVKIDNKWQIKESYV